MSSETAPVSEPVYDYSDDKHVVKCFCMDMRSLRESSIPPDLSGMSLTADSPELADWSGGGDSDEYDFDLIYLKE